MNNFRVTLTFLLGTALLTAPGMQARTCTGASDLLGSFAWAASRATTTPPAAPTTTGSTVIAAGVTPATITGSNTALGALAAGSANSAAFASVGRVYFDGAGLLWASSDLVTPLQQVGTYTANP